MGSTTIAAIVSVLVGGGLAAASVVGLVNAQTGTPEESPVNVGNVSIEYGSN
ncbi:hypothetical protein KUV85_03645 [Nocardioides panacisoli]|uniref:hypothetical protein n=1 Tax=Nocardioides panacisoli TaxID=627624 RepID=UPI001C62AD45|nr:hypothetical protein [Nocardioides panacisoli]QYJ04787.1 hypothetical protein KUV85_03645 [Nocardioides panacisoli]